MRKIIFLFAALLTMSIATAQTDPKEVPKVPQTPPPPPKTEIKDNKPIEEEKIYPNAVSKDQKKEGEVQPLKDEIKTHDHVKSTPVPDKNKDVKVKATTKKVKKSKKTVKN